MYIDNSSPTFFLRHQTSCIECSKILQIDVTFLITKKHYTYSEAIDSYSSIKDCTTLVICNKNRTLQEQDYLDILYAIDQGKQIILLDLPIFVMETPLFARQLILAKLSKMLLLDITLLDQDDVLQFMNGLNQAHINYTLTRNERTIIRSLHKKHFRLLEKIAP